MAEPNADETFELFEEHWKKREPFVHLDNPKTRDQVMSIVAAMMSILVVAPEVMDDFIAGCRNVAIRVVPEEAQQRIKSAVESA